MRNKCLKAKGKGQLITFQISRINEKGPKSSNLRRNEINLFHGVKKEKEQQINSNEASFKNVDKSAQFSEQGTEINPHKTNSQDNSPLHRSSFKASLFSPTNRLTKEKETFGPGPLKSSEKQEKDKEKDKGKIPNKPIIKTPNINLLSQIERSNYDPAETAIRQLDVRSQNHQRTQLKKITQILQSNLRRSFLEEHHEKNPEIIRKNKKGLSMISENENPLLRTESIKENPLNPLNTQNIRNKLQKQTTVLVPKEQFEKNVSLKQFSENQMIPSSENIDQTFVHKVVIVEGNEIHEFFEAIDEIPMIKNYESPLSQIISNSRLPPTKKPPMLSRYRTLNDDFDDFSQFNINFSKFFLKYNKFFLNFSKNQEEETLSEYKAEISQEYNSNSKLKLALYICFNLVIALCWIIINGEIIGFKGFFPTRIVTLAVGFVFIYYWAKESLREFEKSFIYLFYLVIAVQIFVFTAVNPEVEISQEIEILAWYLSITSYAFMSFIENIVFSFMFIIGHGIYLYIINDSTYLMLHSSFVVVLFNLAIIHLKIKISIDHFNTSRVNIIKKKQLNNLIVNLLPTHVKFLFICLILYIFF